MKRIYCSSVAHSVPEIIKLETEHLLELFAVIKNICSTLLEEFSQANLDKSIACIKQYIVEYKKYMQHTKQKYERLLLETLLLLLRYDAHLSDFQEVSIEDLQRFNSQPESLIKESPIKEYFKNIGEKDFLKLQAFLFDLTADIGLNGITNESTLITNHISYIAKQLAHELSPLLKAVLNMCKNDYKQVKHYLLIINKGPNWYTELDIGFNNSLIKNTKEVSLATEAIVLPHNQLTMSSLQTILSRLHLVNKYPQQLSLRDALLIKPEISSPDINLSNLPYVVLHKIIACDYESRSFLLPSEAEDNIIEVSGDSENDSSSDSENDSCTETNNQSIIHPVDTILALLHCSDNFLRQVLLAKLSVCQMAIPLLLPDTVKGTLTLLLWALRSVKKTWNTLDRNGKQSIRKSSIVDYEGPVISFLKCGKLNTSKSELLNNIIGEENIFFHWNLESQNCRKTITQGVVELSCYYPRPNMDKSNFSDVIIFTNLRGDAIKHTKQVAFIENISFISFILMSKRSITSDNEDVKILLQKLAHSPGGLVILLTDAQTYKRRNSIRDILQCDNFSVICIKSKSSAVIQREVRSYITHKLQNIHSDKFISISCHAETARKLDITVDEDDIECIRGKESALQVMKHITKSKRDTLPLQGTDLWGTWATHNKERYRYKQKQDLSVAEYMQSKDEEKTAVRLLQFHCNYSQFTREFLVNLVQSRNERNYFLHWLKECLNNRSKDALPTLEMEYEQIYKKIKSASATDVEVSKKIKNLLNQKNKRLIDASFGLEHCFREVGQLYEAVKGIQKDKISTTISEYISVLPQIAAEALIDGFELEIMDGEASHIPITWVQAIFNYLESKFLNKNLFVLSILGVQSSGKSTLLNTMFGLQFNVSAGRCTRGAFVRLLRVDEVLKTELHYDYILIIDTEGIRAPELMSDEFEQHDNELATFVIGLADFTIINIYGESPSELNDILQTVLHAFIRMKKVEKNPGCLFVHQNVTEKFASNSNKQFLLNSLDKLTVVVSKEENLQYSKFQDVINFEEDHMVYCFTGLWKGDPPMAPINPGYSQSAQQLKKALLKLIARQQQYCTFTAFKQRILSLWEAVLKEGFVFNFKNSIEMSAYGELDVHFNKWSWQLHEALEHELIKCDNEIKSSKHNADNAKNECIYQSSKELDAKILVLLKDLDNFFEKHDHATVLSKYYFSTRQELESLKKECNDEIKHYCKILTLEIENNREKEEMISQYQEKIRVEITELVANSGPNEDLQCLFEESWKNWLENFICKNVSSIPFPDNKQICNNIESNLIRIFANEQSLLMSQLKDSSIEERSCGLVQNPFEVMASVHINACGNQPALLQDAVYSETNKLIKEASSSIQQKLDKLNVYNSALIEGELNSLYFSINTFNCDSKKFKFTSQYKVDIALFICVSAAREIKAWVEKLRQQNDPILSLQQQKQKFFMIFENKYFKITAEKAAAIQLCNSLSDAILIAVIKRMPLKMVSYLKESNINFSSKSGFKVQVLKDLAQAENFASYKSYILDSTTSFKSWAKLYVEQLCNTKSIVCDGSILIELANKEVKQVISVIQNAISVAGYLGNSKWLKRFCTTLNSTIEVNESEWNEDLKDIKEFPERMKSFKMYLTEELSLLEKSGIISHKTNLKFFELTEAAGNTLYESIVGKTCEFQCPFCKEECDNSTSNHTLHSVKLHRPQCIGRTTWLKDKKLVIDVCNTLVASNNDIVITESGIVQRIAYKEYHKKYPQWNIPGESMTNPPTYWMWVIVRFYDEILSWTDGNETDIPDVWRRISKEQAIESLVYPNNL